MIQVILSVNHIDDDLPPEDKRAVARAGIAYHILNFRNGRALVSATLPTEDLLDTFFQYFTSKNREPKVISDHYPQGHRPGQSFSLVDQGDDPPTEDITGTPQRVIDSQEFLDSAPDLPDGGRPVSFYQIIKPSGWANWRL